MKTKARAAYKYCKTFSKKRQLQPFRLVDRPNDDNAHAKQPISGTMESHFSRYAPRCLPKPVKILPAVQYSMKSAIIAFFCLLLIFTSQKGLLAQTELNSSTLVGVNNDGKLTFTPVPNGSSLLAMERRVLCFDIYSQNSNLLGHVDFGTNWPYMTQCLLGTNVLGPGTNWIVATIVSYAMLPDSSVMTTNFVTNILSVTTATSYTVSAQEGESVTYFTKTDLTEPAWIPVTVPNPSSFPCSEAARYFNLNLSTNIGTQIQFHQNSTIAGQPVN